MKYTDTRAALLARAYSERGTSPRTEARDNLAVAEDIIRSSRSAGIYAHQSPSLVALLMKVDLDAQVPHRIYAATAEVLVWLYQIETGTAPAAKAAETGP